MLHLSVGPTKLYPGVEKYIQEAIKKEIVSISHRGEGFQSIFTETTNALRSLLNIPSDYHVFFMSSATEGMERVLQNSVAKKSLHFVNGAFSKRFYTMAGELGKEAEIVEKPYGEGFDFKKQNVVKNPDEIELVCFTHNETSTGVMIDLEKAAAHSRNYNNALVALDATSSVPYGQINFSDFDFVFWSVQKGFGLPAGLGVLVASQRAVTNYELRVTSDELKHVGTYHSFSSLVKYEMKNQTPETPNVLLMYVLSKVARDMKKKGLPTICKETEEKMKLLSDMVEKIDYLKFFVQKKEDRSKTTLVAEVKGGSTSFINDLEEKGIVISSGYGPMKKTHIRIANFPVHTLGDMQRLAETL